MAGMSLNARRTLTTMGTELSAEFVIFEPDDTLIDYVKARNPKPFTPTMPDADAVYKERRTIDLGPIEPLVALPDAVVNNSVGISEVAGRKIDQAFIGACCNGTLDDLAVAARVVKGRKVAPGTRFIVTPSTEAIHRAALAAGYVATLMEAGAIVTPATCGACVGGHMGVLGPGRGVHHREHAQLQGPHGRSVGAHLHGLAGHRRRIGARRTDRRRGRVLPGRRVMRSGRVWKFGDNINTDLMLPGPYLYRDAEDQARAVFMNNRPGWVDQVQHGDAIVGGFNYGMGSSRPAARSLRNCGVGFLLAETINGLFFRNAVNYGLLACECSGVSTAFEEGDTAELDIETWSVRNPRSGQTLKVLPVPQQLLSMMLGGGMYPVLEREGLIAPRSM